MEPNLDDKASSCWASFESFSFRCPLNFKLELKYPIIGY